jgi:hypothetical protein
MLKRWTDAKPRRPFGRDYRLALLFRAQVVDDVHAVHVMVYISISTDLFMSTLRSFQSQYTQYSRSFLMN